MKKAKSKARRARSGGLGSRRLKMTAGKPSQKKAKPSQKKKKRRVIKSAVTGKFVSKKYAAKHPRSTFWERLSGGGKA
jgi:hypothetical protein